MSRRRPSGQPVAVIEHPNDPSIQVTVRKPTRAEAYRHSDRLANYQRALQVYDKDGHELFNKDGSRAVYVQQLFPYEMALDSLQMSVTTWAGLMSEDGSPIPYAGAESLPTLFEEWLDCDVEESVTETNPATGETTPAMRKVRRAFSQHINRRLADPKLFDKDPLVSSSASQ